MKKPHFLFKYLYLNKFNIDTKRHSRIGTKPMQLWGFTTSAYHEDPLNIHLDQRFSSHSRIAMLTASPIFSPLSKQ